MADSDAIRADWVPGELTGNERARFICIDWLCRQLIRSSTEPQSVVAEYTLLLDQCDVEPYATARAMWKRLARPCGQLGGRRELDGELSRAIVGTLVAEVESGLQVTDHPLDHDPYRGDVIQAIRACAALRLDTIILLALAREYRLSLLRSVRPDAPLTTRCIRSWAGVRMVGECADVLVNWFDIRVAILRPDPIAYRVAMQALRRALYPGQVSRG